MYNHIYIGFIQSSIIVPQWNVGLFLIKTLIVLIACSWLNSGTFFFKVWK